MKTRSFLLFALAPLAAFCEPSVPTLTLQDLTPSLVQQMLEEKEDFTIACDAGTILPLQLCLQGDVLALHQQTADRIELELLKSCLIRSVDNQLFCSTNGQDWKSFAEFFTGELKASVTSPEGKPIARLELELHER